MKNQFQDNFQLSSVFHLKSYLMNCVIKRFWSTNFTAYPIFEPRHEKTRFLNMRKQRCRSASLFSLYGQYISSPFLIQNFQPLAIFCACTVWFVSDQVRTPKDWFSYIRAHFIYFSNPNMKDSLSSALTQWPSYNTSSQQYIRLKANQSAFPIESHYIANRIHFWNTLAPVLMEQCDNDCSKCGQDSAAGAGSMHQAICALVCVLLIIQAMFT